MPMCDASNIYSEVRHIEHTQHPESRCSMENEQDDVAENPDVESADIHSRVQLRTYVGGQEPKCLQSPVPPR